MRRALYWLLILHVVMVPFERVLSLVSSSGEDSVLKPYRVVGIAFSALWLLWRIGSGYRFRLDVGDKTFLALFTLGPALALFWHVVDGNNLELTIVGSQLILFGLALYIAIKDLSLTRREIEGVLLAYTVAQLVGIAIGYLIVGETGGRFRALYRNPNQLGIAVANCLIFVFAQFLLLPRAKPAGQVFRVLTAALLAAVIALTGSRGATAGAVAGIATILVMLAVARRSSSSAGRRLAGFAVILALLAAVGYGRFEEAWSQTDSQSRFERDLAEQGAEGRWELWRGGWQVGLDHYGIGVGTFQYLTYHLDAMRELRIPVSSADRPLGTHSDYVDLFVSYGVLGVYLFCRYVVIRLQSLWRASRLRVADMTEAHLAPMGLALLVGGLVFQVSQNSFQGTEYFLMMALIDSMSRRFAHGPEPTARPARETTPLRPRPAAALSARTQ